MEEILRRRHTGPTARFVSVNEVRLLIWPTWSTEMGSTHQRDSSRRCTFCACTRCNVSKTTGDANLYYSPKKKRKTEIPGPSRHRLRLHCLSGMFTILTSGLHWFASQAAIPPPIRMVKDWTTLMAEYTCWISWKERRRGRFHRTHQRGPCHRPLKCRCL